MKQKSIDLYLALTWANIVFLLLSLHSSGSLPRPKLFLDCILRGTQQVARTEYWENWDS
jgi:hypothetical protein